MDGGSTARNSGLKEDWDVVSVGAGIPLGHNRFQSWLCSEVIQEFGIDLEAARNETKAAREEAQNLRDELDKTSLWLPIAWLFFCYEVLRVAVKLAFKVVKCFVRILLWIASVPFQISSFCFKCIFWACHFFLDFWMSFFYRRWYKHCRCAVASISTQVSRAKVCDSLVILEDVLTKRRTLDLKTCRRNFNILYGCHLKKSEFEILFGYDFAREVMKYRDANLSDQTRPLPCFVEVEHLGIFPLAMFSQALTIHSSLRKLGDIRSLASFFNLSIDLPFNSFLISELCSLLPGQFVTNTAMNRSFKICFLTGLSSSARILRMLRLIQINAMLFFSL